MAPRAISPLRHFLVIIFREIFRDDMAMYRRAGINVAEVAILPSAHTLANGQYNGNRMISFLAFILAFMRFRNIVLPYAFDDAEDALSKQYTTQNERTSIITRPMKSRKRRC